MSSKNWIFTLNETEDWKVPLPYTKDSVDLWREPDMNFLLFQVERGREGHIHLQGCVQFKKKIRLTGAKKIMDKGWIHMEVMRGSVDQAIEYCSKSDTKLAGPWSWGNKISGQGARTDLAAAAAAIRSGKTRKQVAEEFPTEVIRYGRGLEQYRTAITPVERERDIETLWIWGPTGVGKTHKAFMGVDDVEKIFRVEEEGKWWDGYDGQKIIMFDDFMGQVPIGKMLNYLDKWPLQVPVKGAFVRAQWNRVVITSNFPPEECYMKKHMGMDGRGEWQEDTLAPATRAALMRRITMIVHMPERGVEEVTKADDRAARAAAAAAST